MESFEPLDLRPELIDALAAEGYETPTAIQVALVPLLRRGGSVVVDAGPGSGAALGVGVSVLERVLVEGKQDQPQFALLGTASDDAADALALSLSALAAALGVRVSAIGGSWIDPHEATVLCGSITRLAEHLKASHLALDSVEFLALDECHEIDKAGGLPAAELVADAVRGAQIVLLGLPTGEGVEDLAQRVAPKAVHLPPRSRDGRARRVGEGTVGDLSYRVVSGDPFPQLLELIAARLSQRGYEHVLVHFRSDDQAADAGDRLVVHGHTVGSPGDANVTIWLSVAGTPLPEDLEGPLASIGYQVPADVESMRLQHVGRMDCVSLVTPRELPHLRQTAAEAGFRLTSEPVRDSERLELEIRQLGDVLEARIDKANLASHMLLLRRLSERFDPMEIAAAALSIAFDRSAPHEAVARGARPEGAQRPQTWTRLFVSVGERDGVKPGDLLGAVTGETGIEGAHVGKIDIHDAHTLIDVDTAVAHKVVKSINGITIRGRSVRADFDRGTKRGPSRGKPVGGRAAGGRPGGGRPRGRD